MLTSSYKRLRALSSTSEFFRIRLNAYERFILRSKGELVFQNLPVPFNGFRPSKNIYIRVISHENFSTPPPQHGGFRRSMSVNLNMTLYMLAYNFWNLVVVLFRNKLPKSANCWRISFFWRNFPILSRTTKKWAAAAHFVMFFSKSANNAQSFYKFNSSVARKKIYMASIKFQKILVAALHGEFLKSISLIYLYQCRMRKNCLNMLF